MVFLILIPSEQCLCGRVFTSVPPSYADLAFYVSCAPAAAEIVSFATDVACGDHSPERLFGQLNLYETVRSLLPELDPLLSDGYSAELLGEVVAVHKALCVDKMDLLVLPWIAQNMERRIWTYLGDGEGSSSTNPDRRSTITNPGKAQYEGISSPSGPYPLLEQYAELANSGRTSILHPEEHDKRSHMVDIEWTASRNIINNLREMELICQVKETDFRRRIRLQRSVSAKTLVSELEWLNRSPKRGILVNLKNFKQIQEELEVLKTENKRLTQAVKDLTQEILENRPLTERQINNLLAKIVEQPKAVEERAVKLTEDLEALKATENIEAPSLGFVRPADHKGPTSGTTAAIKQANTQIQLLVTILERLEALDERIRKLEAKESISSTNLPEEERATIVPAEVLYHSRQDDVHHRVYTHLSEEAILVTTNQVDRTFIQPESFNQLQRSEMRFIHMGVIQVRIQILHRQEEGTLVLIVFTDNRWQGDQAIFATMKVDLAHGIQNVVDYLASSGIRALPGRRYNTRDVLGQNWIIRQSTINILGQPTEVTTRNLLDGRISLHFENYQVPSALIQARSDNEDEERAHTIAVLLADEEEDILYVKCLTSTTILPQRRTEGSAGYDLAVSQNYHIPPYGQAMLNTGISIKTPKGTYARITPRSSYAMRGMIIGGGVVDSYYRGEIKILVYNYSDDDMDFAEGEHIAQLILECCKTPPTIQVHDLDKTKRQDRGFGSTSSQCKDDKANPLCEGCPNCDDSTSSAASYDYYVAPHPSYIDDREYIEYQPQRATTQQEENINYEVRREARQALIREEILDEPQWHDYQYSFEETHGLLRDSRKYRAELRQLESLPKTASNHSPDYLCMTISDTQAYEYDDDDYIAYLQYLTLQPFNSLPTGTSSEDFTNPFAVESGGEEAEQPEVLEVR
ncbi:hypothetical protein ZIOFF_045781 [Zingiber officinale]|uniref:dUTP diphosphatase n=1 Tax=Zingiber officinale TaxID=94328 RepID=A0A8J5L1J0_ZINOF|nr:hypothetical protein ZIOFF_045781 [Zingiber officinale]